jgi:integrase/recombinase XerD
MRIGDGATCPVDRLNGDRLFPYAQTTGVPVNVKLPAFVVVALNTMLKVSSVYFFWTGEGSKETVAGNWRRSLRKLFTLAKIKGGHPHRFRDTFAVELLLAGVPLERVSVLLGHTSIKVTEKHYAPCIRARRNNWRPIWSEAGRAIRSCSRSRRVHLRYTATRRPSTN